MTHNHDDFDTRFKASQEQAAKAADAGFSALSASLRGLIDMQAVEIERLRTIIENGTAIPERHAAEISIAATVSDGRTKNDILVKDNAGTLWMLPNAPRSPYAVPHCEQWVRLPNLPQAADEMNAAPRRNAEGE